VCINATGSSCGLWEVVGCGKNEGNGKDGVFGGRKTKRVLEILNKASTWRRKNTKSISNRYNNGSLHGQTTLRGS
jgi:hypothetical protein